MLRVAVWLLAILGGGGVGAVARLSSTADNLLTKIEQGREQLKNESVQLMMGTVGTRRVRVGRHRYKDVPITGIVGREMALAVLDTSGEIKTVRAVKRDSGFQVLTRGFNLQMRRENGLNSDIACIDPVGGKVVAVKYPVSNEGNRFGGGAPVIQALYTPYSAEIKTDEVIKRGIDVQNSLIEKAYSRLRGSGVLSRAFPGRPIVDVIPKDVLRVLLLNEHIDPGEFKSAGLTGPLVERVLTVIGTNHDKAYAYSISPARARGLVQMIPSTYSLMLNKYPGAGLRSDFVAGMAGPIKPGMGPLLLFDFALPSIRSRSDLPSEEVGPYL